MKPLKQLLSSYHSHYHEEMVYKQQMIRLLDIEKNNAFNRTCLVGHFTASCWLVNPEQDHYLLMHHQKLDRWLQPGGHCDGRSDVLQVAIKEAQEETGIHSITPISSRIFDLDIHFIPRRLEEHTHLHYDIRFLLKAGTNNISFNHEAKDMKWFSTNTNTQSKNPSIRRMHEKWKALHKPSRQRQPAHRQ